MQKIVQTTAPSMALTLAEAKTRLVLDDDFTDHDDMLTAMIGAATQSCEAYSGHHFMQRTNRLYLDDVPAMVVLYNFWPVVTVTGIYYLDANGDEQTLATSDWVLDPYGDPATITIKQIPTVLADTPNIMWVDVVTGYGANGADEATQRANIPAWAVDAMHAQLALRYDKREDAMLNVGATAGNGHMVKATEYLMHPHKRNFI